jgi:hypothetical protein
MCVCVCVCVYVCAYVREIWMIAHFLETVSQISLRFSALRADGDFLSRNFLVLIPHQDLSQFHGHNAAGRLTHILEKFSEFFGYRDSDLSTCSIAPQSNVPNILSN